MAQLSLSLGRRPLLAQFALGAMAVGLVAFAYYVIFYSEVASNIEKQRRQQGALKTEIAQLKQAATEYQRDLSELADRQQRQRELSKALPATTEYPAFLSAVQTVANVSGCLLLGWTPQDEVVQKFYAKVPMKIRLAGRYHQVAKFFFGVGQLDRIINVENITLGVQKRGAEGGAEAELYVECLATAFHALPNPVRPAGVSGERPR